DRRSEMQQFRPGKDTDVDSSYDLLDYRMQGYLDRGMDIVDADAAMKSYALSAYRASGWEKFLDGRARILAGLFEEESFGRQNMTLAGHLDWWLNDGFGRSVMKNFLEKRWNYRLSPALAGAIDEGHFAHP